MPSLRSAPFPARPALRRLLRLAAVVLVSAAGIPDAVAQGPAQERPSIGDAEFWKFFVTMSEKDGHFLSENFVSNEVGFQHVIPTLQQSLTPGGVYVGVGPEQNFTYIANLAPRMAVIFDIRRQNAMQHLMYKALFELSPTRAEFVARLFSRPAVTRLGPAIAVEALFDSAAAAAPSDSAYQANKAAILQHLTVRHGFALSADDIASIEHVYEVFFAAGPDVNYGYRPGMPVYVRTSYPTFGMLQSATNQDSVRMAFLATEENYRSVRSLQQRNLIIPVVGDFGGPTAIRAVGDYLREHRLTVTAFYVSNVEQYLFRDRDAASDRFYGNVSSLPLDSTSMFIRSVPRTGSGTVGSFSVRPAGSVPATGLRFVFFRDSAGVRTITTSLDSAGNMVTRTTRDSAGIVAPLSQDTSLAAGLRAMIARRDSIARGSTWQVYAGPATPVMMGGLLTSGLASMQSTLQAFFSGQLKTYSNVIDMTKIGGWR